MCIRDRHTTVHIMSDSSEEFIDSAESDDDEPKHPHGTSSSYIGGTKETITVVKKRGGKPIKLIVSREKKKNFGGESIPIEVEIVNDTNKGIKSIDAWLQTVVKDGKKIKIEKVGSHQQYFQGARFPLPGCLGYKGEVVYPLPKDLFPTSDELRHELVVDLPYAGRVKTQHLRAFIPILIPQQD
eukprot:TRINITY_DN610_c0_g1_i1.p1 TRINITY_DN610_c0_g1~~TRINITY_DN610_c0_g1_i1.p1  ORF type:complete len:184 (-),score=32.76 TRINITY_DN610_c0_g1_i1:98-649(-)